MAWDYVPNQQGNPMNFYGYAIQSLAANKQGIFSFDKNKGSAILLDKLSKAYAKLGKKDYEAFLRFMRKAGNTEELPEVFQQERIGFRTYLSILNLESGVYGALMLAFATEMGKPPTDELLQATLNARCRELEEGRTDVIFPDGENYQYKPPTQQFYPNDKISKNFRTATDQEWEQGILKVDEKDKKHTVSTVRMDLEALHAMGFTRLDLYDFYVLHTCLAIQNEGNKVTSIPSLYRAMTGKTGNVKLTAKAEEEIITSLKKCMSILAEVSADGICKIHKGGKVPDSTSIGNLLPAFIKEKGVINGAEVGRMVLFHDVSPLVKVAKAKGEQFIRYEMELLNVPVSSTKQNITVIHYLLNRIEDTRTGKVAKTIALDDVIAFCEYTGERRRLVSLMEKCFVYWKQMDYIKTFKFVADPHNKAKVDKVTFTLHPSRILERKKLPAPKKK